MDWRKNCLRWFDPDTCPWNVFKGLKTESQAKIERPTAADGGRRRPTASFIIFTSACLHELCMFPLVPLIFASTQHQFSCSCIGVLGQPSEAAVATTEPAGWEHGLKLKATNCTK